MIPFFPNNKYSSCLVIVTAISILYSSLHLSCAYTWRLLSREFIKITIHFHEDWLWLIHQSGAYAKNKALGKVMTYIMKFEWPLLIQKLIMQNKGKKNNLINNTFLIYVISFLFAQNSLRFLLCTWIVTPHKLIIEVPFIDNQIFLCCLHWWINDGQKQTLLYHILGPDFCQQCNHGCIFN